MTLEYSVLGEEKIEIGTLKKFLENVPDDYILQCLGSPAKCFGITTNNEIKTVIINIDIKKRSE